MLRWWDRGRLKLPEAATGTVTISNGIVTGIGGTGIGGGNGDNNTLTGIGDSGSFTTTKSGNAIIKASGIADQSQKNDWSGIIFEDSNGGVYGYQTLNSAFEVNSGENLLIAEGATLTTNNYLTNKGAVYVDGTVSGTVSGDVYYPLFLTNCTATNTTPYNSKSYEKLGNIVTLTADTAPAGQFLESWTITGVTVENNSFTMPANAVTARANFEDALKITTQPESKTLTYGETTTLSVAAQFHESLSGTMTYQWQKKDSDVWSNLSGGTSGTLNLSGLSAGTHTYRCAVEYGDYTVTSNEATVTVNKAAPELLTHPTANTLTYNGSAQALVSAGTTEDGKVQYALSQNATYSDTIPTGENAGTYTVWYKVAGDDNHNDSTLASVSVTIGQAELTVQSPPSVEEKTYAPSQTLKQVALQGGEVKDIKGAVVSGNWAWENQDTVPTVGNSGYYAVFTPSSDTDKNNYQPVRTVIPVPVKKAVPQITAVPSVTSRKYDPAAVLKDTDLIGGSASGADGKPLAGTWRWKETDLVPVVKNEGYEAVFTPEDTTNYESVTKTVAVPVEKADQPANKPEGAQVNVSAPAGAQTIAAVTLPEGWSWEDGTRELLPGSIIKASAVYTDTENYEKYKTELEILVPAEIILSETDTTYTIGEDTGAVVKCTGVLSAFEKVFVDGTEVSSENYTLTEGSTILTFKQAYMDKLSLGEHTVTLSYPSGNVETAITVKEKAQETENPGTGTNQTETDQTDKNQAETNQSATQNTESNQNQNGTGSNGNSTGTSAQAARTGDDTPIALYLSLLLLAVSGMFGAGWMRKKKKTASF